MRGGVVPQMSGILGGLGLDRFVSTAGIYHSVSHTLAIHRVTKAESTKCISLAYVEDDEE